MSQNEDGERPAVAKATESSSSIGIPCTNNNGLTDGNEQGGPIESRENGEGSRKVSSSQILINDREETSASLNYDTDDTLSGEESVEDLDSLKQTNKKEPILNENSAQTGEATASSNSTIAVPEVTRRRSSTPFIEKKGFLYKMGGHRKSWKNRYFVLRPGVFQYFKDTKCQKMLGEVKLKNLNIFFPGAGERKQSYQFTLHTESSWNRRPDYVMAAQSEGEMKEWITAFKLAGNVVDPASEN